MSPITLTFFTPVSSLSSLIATFNKSESPSAWPVDTFVKANDFNGKTVIPFCTSSSSGLGRSGELLAEEANGGNWLEGHRFRSNPSDSDIQNWTDSL